MKNPDYVDKKNKYMKSWRLKNREKRRPQRNTYARKRESMNRLEVLSHYSPSLTCQCPTCKTNNSDMLTIDHINNDGKKHRLEINHRNIYHWLKNNNYPPGFQVLCWNCNKCKGSFGECHHKNPLIKHKSNRRYRDKKKVISHYSNGTNKCEICGESIFFFLAIDHINNDGAEQRQKLKDQYSKNVRFYQYLINNDYPPGFRVLCHNCNSSLYFRNKHQIINQKKDEELKNKKNIESEIEKYAEMFA